MSVDLKKARIRYHQHKKNAKQRGIDWQFTFEVWVAWWGEDFHRRGCRAGDLQMQRIGDRGPYHPDNVVKGTPRRNRRTSAGNMRHDRCIQQAEQIKAIVLARESGPGSHWSSLDEDEQELMKMFGVKTRTQWHA